MTKLTLPKLPRKLNPETPELLPESSYQSLLLETDWSGTQVDAVSFQGVQFTDSNLSESRWEWARLQDVLMEHCNLSGLKWTEAGLNRVRFYQCRLLGAQFLDLESTHLILDGCDARMTFWQGNFKQAHFKNTNFSDASFDQVDLRKAVFRDCNLSRTNLRECKLEETDFRGSVLQGFRVQTQHLQGTIIETAQLPELAHLLGVVVNDDPLRES